jgi:molecular chaperone HscB
MSCWGCHAEISEAEICPRCGRLQPVQEGDREYYRFLGFPEPRLNLDEKALEELFHAKSRQFHPDRFQRKDPKELEISLQRSAVLNEAYRILREKKSRARYVVERFGEEKSDSKNVPAELAELYFDLQDLLADPTQTERLQSLMAELKEKRVRLETHLQQLFGDWDQSLKSLDQERRKRVLRELRDTLHQDNYADSMLRDLRRRLGEERDE